MIISTVQGVPFWYDKYKMVQNARKAICIPENKTFTLNHHQTSADPFSSVKIDLKSTDWFFLFYAIYTQ